MKPIEIVSSRINQLLKDNVKSGRWVCKFVLDNYPSSSFSKFTSGQRMPPEWIIQRLAEYFHVRKAWIRGYDDFKTEHDIKKHYSNAEITVSDIVEYLNIITKGENNNGKPL